MIINITTIKTNVVEGFVLGTIGIDWDNIYKKIVLIRYDTMIL